MNTQQIIGIVLLLAGAVLLFMGYQATQGAGEQVYESFTGRFTESTTWYLITGGVAAIGGLVLLFIRR